MSKRLVLLGCSHIGHKDTDYEMLKKYLEIDADILDIGDTFEAGVPDKKNKMMEQNLTLDEQFDRAVALYYPHKSRIIGKCTSNHSNRVWESLGFDFDKAFCAQLGVKYFGARGQILWNGLRISFHHGYGSGCNEWKDAMELLTIYPDSDIIVVSHKHFKEYKIIQNYLRGKLHKVYLIRTGALLKRARYAEIANYIPHYPGFSIITYNKGVITID